MIVKQNQWVNELIVLNERRQNSVIEAIVLNESMLIEPIVVKHKPIVSALQKHARCPDWGSFARLDGPGSVASYLN